MWCIIVCSHDDECDIITRHFGGARRDSITSGLGYANLLAFTPLGILSTSLMVRCAAMLALFRALSSREVFFSQDDACLLQVPLVPLFAKHREPAQWHVLRKLVGKVCLHGARQIV